MRRSYSLPIITLSLLLVAACRKQEVTSYRVPKEREPEAPAAAASPHATNAASTPAPGTTAPQPGAPAAPASNAMANTAVSTASGASLTWTAPPNWQSKAGSAMRKATFAIPGEGGQSAELSVTAFPGDVGGEIANVNRWRGQLQLDPLADSEVAKSVTRLEANGLKIGVVDIANPNAAAPTRLLGAMVPFEGATWFFKLTGPDALVAKEKPAFLNFLQTLKPATP